MARRGETFGAEGATWARLRGVDGAVDAERGSGRASELSHMLICSAGGEGRAKGTPGVCGRWRQPGAAAASPAHGAPLGVAPATHGGVMEDERSWFETSMWRKAECAVGAVAGGGDDDDAGCARGARAARPAATWLVAAGAPLCRRVGPISLGVGSLAAGIVTPLPGMG